MTDTNNSVENLEILRDAFDKVKRSPKRVVDCVIGDVDTGIALAKDVFGADLETGKVIEIDFTKKDEETEEELDIRKETEVVSALLDKKAMIIKNFNGFGKKADLISFLSGYKATYTTTLSGNNEPVTLTDENRKSRIIALSDSTKTAGLVNLTRVNKFELAKVK